MDGDEVRCLRRVSRLDTFHAFTGNPTFGFAAQALYAMKVPAYPRDMSPIVQQLADKLDRWEPEVSQRVEALVAEIMELADTGALGFLRSRAVEQEVLDLLDEPISRLSTRSAAQSRLLLSCYSQSSADPHLCGFPDGHG
jgi:hypothetical protein